MPLFAVICHDRPNALEIRLATREKHLGHIAGSGIVTMAGPLMVDGQMRGSLVILDADSLESARAWADADPYAAAGLFDRVEVVEWKKVIG